MSYYEETKRSRLKVNNFTLGFSGNTSSRRCSICLEQWKLQIKVVDNVRGYWCHGCGQLTPIDSNKEDSQFSNKFGSTSKPNSFIISQPKRGSKYDSTESELKEDIGKLTGSSSVVVKDTQEETSYDTAQQ